MRRQTLLCVMAGMLVFAGTVPASAQEMPEERTLLRISPIALMFANFKLGAEFMVGPKWAADIMLNHNRNFFFTDIDISSAMVGARYYPTAAFQGFSVAGHVGGMRFAFEDQEESHPILHVEMAYSWLLGESRRFYVAPAVGAARLFASGTVDFEDDEDDFEWTTSIPFPTWRLQIGYRF